MGREWGDPVADRVKREVLCYEIAQLLPLVSTHELQTIRDAAEVWADETIPRPPPLQLHVVPQANEHGKAG